MDATDFAIGIILIGAIAWLSIVALNQNAVRASIADLYAISEINKPLISPQELCPPEKDFELVQPDRISGQPYYVSAGTTDFNQTYFCFYKKLNTPERVLLSSPRGDFADPGPIEAECQKKTGEYVAGNEFKQRGFSECSLVESRVGTKQSECPNGLSPAGCSLCKLECR